VTQDAAVNEKTKTSVEGRGDFARRRHSDETRLGGPAPVSRGRWVVLRQLVGELELWGCTPVSVVIKPEPVAQDLEPDLDYPVLCSPAAMPFMVAPIA
jgi:hypothetical protein